MNDITQFDKLSVKILIWTLFIIFVVLAFFINGCFIFETVDDDYYYNNVIDTTEHKRQIDSLYGSIHTSIICIDTTSTMSEADSLIKSFLNDTTLNK